MYRNMRNVSVPFFGRLQSNLAIGSQVTISGQVLENSATERFSVNLARGHPYNEVTTDIALHVNPRLEGYGCVVVMNTQRDGHWGQEERASGDNLFRKGINFLLKITVEDRFYKMDVNGIHFATFSHRMGFKEVDTVSINGCVQVNTLDTFLPVRAPRTIATVTKPQIPYITSFQDGIAIGSRVLITGSVPWSSSRFEVNFVTGHQAKIEYVNYANIALHLNPRVDHEQAVVMNSRNNGGWGKEIRSHLNISRGRSFRLEIVVNQTNYTILANDTYSSTFPHRLPYNDVGLVYVDGDVSVDKIEFKKL